MEESSSSGLLNRAPGSEGWMGVTAMTLGTWDFSLTSCWWHNLSENGNNPFSAIFQVLAFKSRKQVLYLNISGSANILHSAVRTRNAEGFVYSMQRIYI
jgi:hypothetical protein